MSSFLPEPPPPPEPAPDLSGPVPHPWAFLLGLSLVEVRLADVFIPSQGVHARDAELDAREIELGAGGMERAVLHHRITIGEWSRAPRLKDLHWSGDSVFGRGEWRAQRQLLVLGPFRVRASGRYDARSGRWEGDAHLPRTLLEEGGEIEAKGRAQGIGDNLASINGDGNVRARHVRLELDRPDWKGPIRFDLGGDFVRDQSLSLSAAIDADLTQMEINQGRDFSKPSGVPMRAEISLNGTDHRIALTRAEIRLDKIAASLVGELFTDPQLTANLRAKLAPAPITDWERFLPRFSAWLTPGTVSAEVHYRGLVKPLGSGEIDGSLEARGLDLSPLAPYLSKSLEDVKGTPVPLSAKPNPFSDRANFLTGHFHWQGGRGQIADVKLKSVPFDVTAHEITIDPQTALAGQLSWSPHEEFLDHPWLAFISDPDTGRPDLPLRLSGTLSAPALSLDRPVLLARALGLLRRNLPPVHPKAHARAPRHRRKRHA